MIAASNSDDDLFVKRVGMNVNMFSSKDIHTINQLVLEIIINVLLKIIKSMNK